MKKIKSKLHIADVYDVDGEIELRNTLVASIPDESELNKWMKENKKCLEETGKPLCPNCHKPMKHYKNQKHIFRCDCYPKMLLSIG